MSEQVGSSAPAASGWRLQLGGAMFALSILLPAIGVPLVASMDLAGGQAATFSGALLVAAELTGLGAVAVMGKSGYQFIKGRLLAFLRRHGPPRAVSRARYRVGLVMFAVPVLFGWGSFYVLGPILEFGIDPLVAGLSGDILLLASLFVLGGEFWDKVRSLFVHDAAAVFPRDLAASGRVEGAG